MPWMKSSATGVAACIALGVTACGGDDAGDTASDAAAGSAPAAEKYAMTLITGVKGDEFYVTMGCGAKAAAEKAGVKLDIQGPDKFDASLQTPIVNAVTAKKPDGVLIAPTDSKAMFAPIQQLSSAGTKIALVDTTLDDPSAAVSQISSDNVAGGVAAGKALVELTGGTGKVSIVNVKPGISTTDQRAQGFKDAIKSTDVEFAGEEFNDDDPAKAASITKAMLAKDPDLKGIFAANIIAAEGVAAGLREAGKTDVKVVTFDAGPKNVADLEEGLIDALIAQKPAQIGEDGVNQLLNELQGKPVTKKITTKFVTVTKDNLAEPASQEALYKSDC